MCGRFTLTRATDQVARRFAAEQLVLPIAPSYNVAPGQAVAAITDWGGRRVLEPLRWGLVPFWAKEPAIGNRLINARAETLAEKPAFRNALTRRRCLVPADGFYEWRQEGGKRQPMYVHMRDGELFAFAGLWEEWLSPDGSPLRTCAVITVPPNALMAEIHNRMPAILAPDDEASWLGGAGKRVEDLLSLLAPYDDRGMEAYPVSRRVNAPTVNDASCIEPLADEG
ncbi:MAG: SOS response-associated peptidase [Chthonomonadales bacterium]|nr:SOS response-associated peptidase [Chthonomonadales bacterium]